MYFKYYTIYVSWSVTDRQNKVHHFNYMYLLLYKWPVMVISSLIQFDNSENITIIPKCRLQYVCWTCKSVESKKILHFTPYLTIQCTSITDNGIPVHALLLTV